MNIELRDYQLNCVQAINSMERGSALVSMATGLGKTVVFSRIKRRGRTLIISHREELVHQPIKYYDCKCGIEQGAEHSHGEEVISASIQTLYRRLDKFKPDEFDLIITDEAHHAAASTYRAVYDYFKPRVHIGFTATPNRGDKVRLDNVFERIIFQRDLKWGIKNGWLTDVRCLRVKVGFNLNNVKRRMGDFVVGELDKSVNNSVANRQVAEIYKKYAVGQTLIFATSVAHAENIASLIDGAVAVSQKTPNRSKIVQDFKDKKIKCIVNCMIFTEGTDIPTVETIIIARPTQNASLYTQMVGRGLRKAENKKFLTLIDCVGVSEKLDVCTAPTLMGLDIDEVPDWRRSNIVGMLTDMEQIIEDECDCPENWIFNVKRVALFANEQGVNLRNINWIKKSNGDLVYQFTNGDRIGIKAINELGKTHLMYFCYDEKSEKFVRSESEEMTLQEASDRAFSEFSARYKEDEKLWNLSEYYSYQGQPATEKQIALLKKLISDEEFSRINENGQLTKGDAMQVITAAKLRKLTLRDLYAMRKKYEKEVQAENEERQKRSLIKIRKIIDKTKRSYKYYAIMMADDLVITNDWSEAERIILQCKERGENCRYKSFQSIEQAMDFLRS